MKPFGAQHSYEEYISAKKDFDKSADYGFEASFEEEDDDNGMLNLPNNSSNNTMNGENRLHAHAHAHPNEKMDQRERGGAQITTRSAGTSDSNDSGSDIPEAAKPQYYCRSSKRRALPKSKISAQTASPVTLSGAEADSDSQIPCNSKIPWTKEEDASLIELVKIHGKMDWFRIGAEIPSRNRKQCRDRYMNHLNSGVKKGDWTREEDNLIFEMQKKLGNKWAIIAQKLPNRTDNAIKNRFWSHKRTSQRRARKEKTINDLKEASRKVDDMPDLHDLPEFKVEETTSMAMHQPAQQPLNHQNKRQKRDVAAMDLAESLPSATPESVNTNVVSMHQILMQHRAERENHNVFLKLQSPPAGPAFLTRSNPSDGFEDDAIFHPYQDFPGHANATHTMEKMPGDMGGEKNDEVYY